MGGERKIPGVVAGGTFPLHPFPGSPLGQALQQGAVPVVGWHGLRLFLKAIEQEDTKHNGDNRGKQTVSFGHLHWVHRPFPWLQQREVPGDISGAINGMAAAEAAAIRVRKGTYESL